MTPEALSRASLGDAADAVQGGTDLAAGMGLYVHVPFCASRCPYCDFNTFAGIDGWQSAYVDALCAEMDVWGAANGARALTSVYVGGGTPTWLGRGLLERLLAHIGARFRLAPDCEITVEANPGTADTGQLAGIRSLGVSRLSLGAQSFVDEELRFLGRIHDAADIRRSVAAARAVGFSNISLDLMFGLPGQDRERWNATLTEVVALGADHVSAYHLTVEPGTPLHRRVVTGRVRPASDDRAADLFEQAMDHLGAAGYRHYEVSSWARDGEDGGTAPSNACRQNLLYWRNGPYLGVGAGAHGHVHATGSPDGPLGIRWANVSGVASYVARMGHGADPGAWHEVVNGATAMGETMMLGLRLLEEGVAYARFRHLHGVDLRLAYPSELVELEQLGLLRVTGTATSLTRRGLMLGNRVFERFLP